MDEARESITQTVTEIKETVTNQYYSVKESVSEALDWRTHFRKRPIAFSVGALSVGFLVGYGLAGTLKGNGRGRSGYPSYQETDVYELTGAAPPRYEDEAGRHSAFHGHSYAAQPILDGPGETSEDERSYTDEAEEQSAGDYSQRLTGAESGSTERDESQQEGTQKPGLYERFKGTSAYDRLQTELASLGDRFIEELSSTAHNVVLPALFAKIKELFGVDLSGKKAEGKQAAGESTQSAQAETNQQTPSARAAGASASASGGPSYATSENRGYGAKDAEATASKGGDSILDLDR